jgi:hypothetical protein
MEEEAMMKLTRREVLARGGGLLAALGLGKFLPAVESPAPEQAPMTASEVIERRRDFADAMAYAWNPAHGIGKSEFLAATVAWHVKEGKSVTIMTQEPTRMKDRVFVHLKRLKVEMT